MIVSFNLFEFAIANNLAESNISFVKQKTKEGAKTSIFNVNKDGTTLGQIKWSSRLRGYAFLPTIDSSEEIKQFIEKLHKERSSK